MRKHNLHLTLLSLLLFMPLVHTVHAQDADHALWTSIDIKKKFKHGLALALEQEYRMRENFSNTDKFQTTIDLSWKPFSFLKGGVAYCMINKNPNDNDRTDWELRHRYVAYVVGSYDLGRFSLSLKEKFQHTYRVGVDADENKANPTNVIRSKLEVDYNIRKSPLKPFASMEVFYALNEPDGQQNPTATKMITETRYAAGLEYAILKNMDVEAGYLYSSGREWDKGDSDYVRSFTSALTLGLSYTF